MATLESGRTALDDAYAKATRDIAGNIVGGAFIAGQTWPTVWVRDAAYAIDLGAGFAYPQIARQTITGVATTDGLWAQDRCAHFGGWPNLTDAIVGAIGAWASYVADPDPSFLRWAYGVTVASLARAEREVFDGGLFRGCASFMESNSAYPLWLAFNGRAVGRMKALSTNVLHYRAYRIAARMAGLLGVEDLFTAKAEALKRAINERLWSPRLGHYTYYEGSHRREGLGEALAALWGVAEWDRVKSMHVTPHGVPCRWPRYLLWRPPLRRAEYYHNGMVWPFVQGYWAWAAAKHGDVGVFAAELGHLTGLAGKAATLHEFYRPHSGRADGSPRQLWSAAGLHAMVHYGLFGMDTDVDRVRFAPVVPEGFTSLVLRDLHFRQMTLTIRVAGHGTQIRGFELDGSPQAAPEIPGDLTGRHEIAITL
ncbi:MGH1-like glycoside hydrolase domain-containing protein [Allorhizocola rhizosphaerae]|uniref:MGH1-like glycoside hydrolase domain-containing protein n=1 Tax=Allorhizocola rhizosphaerae TaxID=1872709 RepID=UPI000E3C866E|nr:hypothetical protein [Allorhizocola rhizosphaerae]